jgi:hypothetical protein
VLPLSLPPLLVTAAGIFLGAPLWAHLLAVLSSLALLYALVRIATRVTSTSMQSVWISAIYAVWFFTALTWLVVVTTTSSCHCT